MAGLLDGVVLNCTTLGTTSPLALGTAVPPYLGMALAGAVSGNIYSYSIVDPTAGASEYGTGAWNAGAGNGTLARNPIWSTAGAGVPISCSGGQLVRITALMEDLLPSAQLGAEFVMLNGTLAISIASNNLTIMVKTKAGNDPSTGDPVLFAFGTAAGTYNVIKVATALNFTINSGNTLGTASGVPFRLWIVAINNGGTVLLGAFQSVTGGATPTAIAPLFENGLRTTGPGTNGGNNAGTIYTSSASLSSVPIRIIGYINWNGGLPTAGTWNIPNNIILFGPGVKKPGDMVQKVYASTSSQASTNSTNFSDTGFSATLTMQSPPNLVQIRISVNGASSDTAFQAGSVRLVRGTTTILTMSTASLAFNSAGSSISNQTNDFLDAPQAAGSTTYKTQFASSSSNSTFYLQRNGNSVTSMSLEEIMA